MLFPPLVSAERSETLWQSLTQAEKQYLQAHPVLTAHNEANWPPFNYNSNGTPKGFAIDYMNTLADRLGVRIRYISGYSWDEYVTMLTQNKLDLILNMAITPSREKRFAFTDPYLRAQHAIYVNVNHQAYYSLSDLAGKRVAFVKGFFIQKYTAQHYKTIRQVLVSDMVQALRKLSQGKVDAVIGKQIVVDYLLRDRLIPNVVATRYIKDPKTISHLAISSNKSHQMLIDIINKAQEDLDFRTRIHLKHTWFGINPILSTPELLTREEKAYLVRKQTVRACLRSDWAPIAFYAHGEARGIVVDTLRSLMHRLKGVRLVWVPTATAETAQYDLERGVCDLLPDDVRTEKTRATTLFSKPYFSDKTRIITRQGAKPVHTLNGIKHQRLAHYTGSLILESLLHRRTDLQTVRVASYRDALEAVEKGTADYTLLPQSVYAYWRSAHPESGLVVGGTAPIKSEFALGIRSNETVLAGILGKVLAQTPPATFRAIVDRWKKPVIIREVDYGALIKMALGFGIVMGIILYSYGKQRRLRRRIEELNGTLETRIADAIERNREQQALMLHRERLARLGEMISMIAHQWRQPLNNLALILQTQAMHFRKGTLDAETMERFQTRAKQQITHMSTTIDDFRNFYRTEKEKSVFCLGEVLSEILHVISDALDKDGIVVHISTEECLEVFGYRNEFQHAILNIITNAQEALVVHREEERKIEIEAKKLKGHTLLRIENNGGEIPETIMSKIFDPYFSNKSEKNGTGLGLYMARIIVVEQMGGEIHVNNTDGGVQFEITIPEVPHADIG